MNSYRFHVNTPIYSRQFSLFISTQVEVDDRPIGILTAIAIALGLNAVVQITRFVLLALCRIFLREEPAENRKNQQAAIGKEAQVQPNGVNPQAKRNGQGSNGDVQLHGQVLGPKVCSEEGMIPLSIEETANTGAVENDDEVCFASYHSR